MPDQGTQTDDLPAQNDSSESGAGDQGEEDARATIKRRFLKYGMYAGGAVVAGLAAPVVLCKCFFYMHNFFIVCMST